jgi:hypothetical protein
MENAEIWKVKEGGLYSYQCVLETTISGVILKEL